MRVRWVLLLLLAVIAAPMVIVLATYARWRWNGGFPPESEPLPLGWLWAALAREVGAVTLTVIDVVILRFAAAAPRPAARENTNHEPTIMLIADSVIGLAAQTALGRRLHTRGCSTTVFRPSSWRLQTAEAARELDAVLRSNQPRSETVLVAFGNAGLLLRYFLRRYRATGIRRVVTIGTAHQGGCAASEKLIGQLSAGDRVPQQFAFIAIASDFDACVSPATRGYYPGAFNIEVRGLGHFSLARSSRVAELIVENLGPVTAPPPRP